MSSRRIQRVGEAFREVIGELIQKVKDPRVGFVTITSVRVTPDLSKAHVYYSVLGDDAQKEATAKGLASAAAFLRTEAGRQLRMKTLPELIFHADDTYERGRRVDDLIREIHQTDEGAE